MELCNVGIGTKMADFQGRNIIWRQITAFWSRMDAIAKKVKVSFYI